MPPILLDWPIMAQSMTRCRPEPVKVGRKVQRHNLGCPRRTSLSTGPAHRSVDIQCRWLCEDLASARLPRRLLWLSRSSVACCSKPLHLLRTLEHALALVRICNAGEARVRRPDVLHHPHKPLLCTSCIASFCYGCNNTSEAQACDVNLCCKCLRKPMLRFLQMGLTQPGLDHRVVAKCCRWLRAASKHLREPLFCPRCIASTHACMDHRAEGDCICLHVALLHGHYPMLCTPGAASLGTSIDD